MSTRSDWFTIYGNDRVGPYSQQQLKGLARSGVLRPEDLVCQKNDCVPTRAVDSIPWAFHDDTQLDSAKRDASTANVDKKERTVNTTPSSSIDAPQNTNANSTARNVDDEDARFGMAVVGLIAITLIAYVVPQGTIPLSQQYVLQATWFLMGTSIVVTTFLLIQIIRPQMAQSGTAYFVFCFTAFVGVFVLFLFQQIAETARQNKSATYHPIAIIIREIGTAYQITDSSPRQHWFIATLLAMFFSVALCEELVKALPVLFMTLSSRNDVCQRSIVFIGSMSGLGFGIAEGFFYSFGTYASHGYPFWVYVVRFLGVVPLHAVWAGGSSLLIYELRNNIRQAFDNRSSKKDGWYEFFLSCVGPLIPAMTLHSFYNSWLGHGWYFLSVLTVIASILLFVAVVAGQNQNSQNNDRNT